GPRHPRPHRGLLSRPSVDEIARYRRHVDDAMHDLIDGDDDAGVAALIELGLHHEQQHQELMLMDIKHVLSCNPTDPAYGTPTARRAPGRRLGPPHHAPSSSPSRAETSASVTTATVSRSTTRHRAMSRTSSRSASPIGS